MIKNATIYKFALPDDTDLGACLSLDAFIPCGPSQESSSGFVPPRAENGAYTERIGGWDVARFVMENKTVPASALRRKADERAAEIERQTGRVPGRKEKKALREDILTELLPHAFAKRVAVDIYVGGGLLILDTASVARSDAAVTALVQNTGAQVTVLTTNVEPSSAMAVWLATQEPPAAFTIDRECELRATDESKAVVRYAKHPLDIDEVRGHIEAGKRPTRLAMTWEDRVCFVLTDGLTLRKVEFIDSQAPDESDKFDSDAAITTGEMGMLIPALVQALGGEMKHGA